MIPLGVIVDGSARPAERISFLKERGFESFSLSFWQHTGKADLERIADEIAPLGVRVSALSVYGNVLSGDESAEGTAQAWHDLLRLAPRFGTALVSGFAGRIPGKPVDQCIDAWKDFFSPLLERAESSGVRLAFENCRMGGTQKTGNWNIAINPDAWDLMQKAVPSTSWGIEWEPGHAVLALADPCVQLESCIGRVLHVHGKDASVDTSNLARNGYTGSAPSGAFRYPGFGDCDWKRLFSILEGAGYGGTVDIECGHDPEYCGGRDDEGLLLSRAYLDGCRSGFGSVQPNKASWSARQVGKTWILVGCLRGFASNPPSAFSRTLASLEYVTENLQAKSLKSYREEFWLTNMPLYALSGLAGELKKWAGGQAP